MFLITVTVGVLVVAAISFAPAYTYSLRFPGSTPLGVTLVVAALATAAVGAAAPGRRGLFLAAFLLLLGGTLLVLADDEDDGRDEGDEDPPWWPEFESGFRAYERRRRRPAGTR